LCSCGNNKSLQPSQVMSNIRWDVSRDASRCNGRFGARWRWTMTYRWDNVCLDAVNGFNDFERDSSMKSALLAHGCQYPLLQLSSSLTCSTRIDSRNFGCTTTTGPYSRPTSREGGSDKGVNKEFYSSLCCSTLYIALRRKLGPYGSLFSSQTTSTLCRRHLWWRRLYMPHHIYLYAKYGLRIGCGLGKS